MEEKTKTVTAFIILVLMMAVMLSIPSFLFGRQTAVKACNSYYKPIMEKLHAKVEPHLPFDTPVFNITVPIELNLTNSS